MEEFQKQRQKLPPESFAIAPEIEPEPGDPIDESSWTELVWLTDDVSIRTSEHHGSALREAIHWWGEWVSLVLDVQRLAANPGEDPLSFAALVVTEETQASIHSALVGFYRQAIADLRSALEAIAVAAYFRETGDTPSYRRWADGENDAELQPGLIRRQLNESSVYQELKGRGIDVWGKNGTATLLYRLLSGFSHGRPFYVDQRGRRLPSTNNGLWAGSNGPVYVEDSIAQWGRIFFEAATTALLVTGLSEPRLASLPTPTDRPYLDFLGRCMRALDMNHEFEHAEEVIRQRSHS